VKYHDKYIAYGHSFYWNKEDYLKDSFQIQKSCCKVCPEKIVRITHGCNRVLRNYDSYSLCMEK